MVTKIRQDRTIFFVALACGLLAIILLISYINKKEKQFGSKITIWVAAVDILKGQVFSNENIVEREILQKFEQPYAIRQDQKVSILGKKAKETILKGQQILGNLVEFEPGLETLSSDLLEGENERAISIPVDEISGVAGYIAPGDRVDIMAIYVVPGKEQNTFSTKLKTILQCITVLKVGYNREETSYTPGFGQKPGPQYDKEYTSVTLKVTAKEAELLTIAENAGRLKLLLRNPDDIKFLEDTDPKDLNVLFQIEKELTKARRDRVVRIFKSGERK